jgi:hypothetical protein
MRTSYKMGAVAAHDEPRSAVGPQPRQANRGADAVAALLSIGACGAALLLLLEVGSIVVLHGFSLRATAASAAIGGTAAWALATASGLRRRRRWALVVALLGLVVGAVTGIGSIVWIVRDPGPPGTDGANYAAMGAAMCTLTSLAVAIPLLFPSTWRHMGAPPPGWYADPGPGRVRWWDGTQWTTWAE